ncbi:MAG: helix-turn-helix domain-containing protein [Alphaproteobacteria bacterium]
MISVTDEEESGCLEAIRRGARCRVAIAAATACSPLVVEKAVQRLVAAGLVQQLGSRTRLVLTVAGRKRTGGDGKESALTYLYGTPIPPSPLHRPREPSRGSPGARLLEWLEGPRCATDLPSRLGVTKTATVAMVLKLQALGWLRIADPGNVLFLLVPRTELRPPLTRIEETILSVLPEAQDTTTRAIGKAVGHSRHFVKAVAERLASLGLVTVRPGVAGTTILAITAAGLGHYQRRGVPSPVPPDTPVRSERRIAVLRLIAEHGPLRAIEVSKRLGLSQTIANSLVQFFKRRGFLEKAEGDRLSGYIPTEEGRKLLTRMPAMDGQDK